MAPKLFMVCGLLLVAANAAMGQDDPYTPKGLADQAQVEVGDDGSLWLLPSTKPESDVFFELDGKKHSLRGILATLADLQQQIDAVKNTDIKNLQEADSATDVSIGNLQSSLDTASSRIDDVTTGLTNLKDDILPRVSNLETNVGDVQSSLTDAEGDIDKLESDVSTLDGTADNLQTEIDDIEASLPSSVEPVKVGVQAAGLCQGNFVKVFRNDQSIPVQSTRGINVYLLNTTSLSIIETKSFDTHGSVDASPALVTYLNTLDVGAVALFGLKDAGTNRLTPAAIHAITTFGSQYISEITHREAWAMIGIKGARPGSVPEDHGGDTATTECVSGNTYRPTKVVTQYFFNTVMGSMNSELARQFALSSDSQLGSQVNPAYSCEELNAAGFKSGVYHIMGRQDGEPTPFEAYCDQDTDGGGWMLMLAVDHEANEVQPVVRDQLPLSPTGSYSYADIQDVGITSVDYVKEVRFFCQTSLHNRKIHFKTTSRKIAETAITGQQFGNADYRIGVTYLSGHTAVIPGESVDGGYSTNDGFTTFPFYKGAANHWGIGENGGNRFECDDYPNGAGGKTLHQVFIRANPAPRGLTSDRPLRDCRDLMNYPGYRSGTYWVVLKPEDGPKKVWCDTEVDGGGWMLIVAYQHERNVNDALVVSIPTSRDYGYSHVLANQLVPAGWIKEVRMQCTTSAHSRMLHFKSTNPDMALQAFDGVGRGTGAFDPNDVVKLPGHSAYLPDQVDNGFTGNGVGLVNFPFYNSGDYHWGIRGNGNRWECDDVANNDDQRTHHLVFIRN